MEDWAAHLCDAVWETILKLGYTPTAISLNYPPPTLKTLFGDRAMPDVVLAEKLAAAALTFPHPSAVRREDVYLVTVPAADVETIYKQQQSPEFLRRLLALTATPGTTPAQIHALFREHNPAVRFYPAPDGDFAEAVLSDGRVYCFDYDDVFVHYHRLLPEDFSALYPEFSEILREETPH